jgi:hypothetical protein
LAYAPHKIEQLLAAGTYPVAIRLLHHTLYKIRVIYRRSKNICMP